MKYFEYQFKQMKNMKNMKYNIKTKLVALLIISSALFSCSEELIEQTNPNATTSATFWQNVEDLQYGLTATYKAFSSQNNYKLVDELGRTDLAWASGYQRPNNTNPYYLQIFNDAATAPNQKWAQLYTTIFRANQVILAAEKLLPTFTKESNIEDATVILAQARFIRGYAYFNLMNAFNQGKIPLYDFIPEDLTDFHQNLKSPEVIREFYLADLQYASENLPIKWTGKDAGRVAAGAAVAVMGQSYLYEGKFPEAAEYFKSVINDYGYSLTPNIGSNFTTMDELNEESILEIVYSMDFKNELSSYDSRDVANTSAMSKQLTGASGGWWGGVCANWLILEYRNDPLDSTDPRNIVTDKTTSQPRLRTFSLRTSWSVALVDDVDMPYYLREETGMASNFNVRMTAFWRKHTNWDLARSEDELSPGKVRSGINERLIRLAEMHLQYAECLIEMGDVDEALVQINKVRRRSGVRLLGPVGSGEYPSNDHDNITYNAESLMHHLRYVELPLELSCEGNGNNRSVDLRRWGVKKQRFQELSVKRYRALDFPTFNEDGGAVTRWGSIVTELDPSDPLVDNNWNEFVEAAQNYQENYHAYWPIPNGESIANPNLND